MRSVIVEFPGSNCVAETQRFLDDPIMVWHTETELPEADLYVISLHVPFTLFNCLSTS